MSLKQKTFQRALEELRSLDGDLVDEVERLPRLREPHSTEMTTAEVEPSPCSELLGNGGHKYGAARPVLTVVVDELLLENSDAESELWQQRLKAAGEHVARAIHATGRIELLNHPDGEAGGTAFLVGPDIIATNQHVAKEFADKPGAQFKLNDGNDVIKPSIDFREERGVAESLEFDVVEVLHLEKHEYPDVAFLRIASRSEDGKPLPAYHLEFFADDDVVETGQYVAAVGYPAREEREDTRACMREIFGDVFDKKRVSPGQVRRTTKTAVVHDCSVLRNNSGSPLVCLETGKVVGIHYTGEFLEDNFALPGVAARAILERVKKDHPPAQPLALVSTWNGAGAAQPRPAKPARDSRKRTKRVTRGHGRRRVRK